jgi:hypothetical protein
MLTTVANYQFEVDLYYYKYPYVIIEISKIMIFC